MFLALQSFFFLGNQVTRVFHFKNGLIILRAMMKISVLTDISVLGFYGYIGDISVDICI